MKKILLFLLALTLMTSIVFAEQTQQRIEALKNTIQVTLNGEKLTSDNLLYDGRTYLQLREVADIIGADLTWDEKTRTSILELDKTASSTETTQSPNKNITINEYIDPLISYSDIGATQQTIYGIAFAESDKSMSYELIQSGLQIYGSFTTDTQLEMLIIRKDNTLIKRTLLGGDLPKVQREADFHVVFVPANPAKGFNFPYMIRIPGENRVKYQTEKDYLMVDMINNGTGHSLKKCIDDVQLELSEMRQNSIWSSQDFGFPIMMPIVPRTGAMVEQTGFGRSYQYEHALSRASVYVRELTTTDSFASRNLSNYNNKNINPENYYDLDAQVKAMIQHAIAYLNSNGFGLESKVIMYGYSASGTFTDRFTNLHPDIVKMVISGATLDDMMLPTDSYKGETLNFPVGTADYKAITGRAFDLDAHNAVARLIYMGKDDTNNTVNYNDCYFEQTQRLINQLFGNPVLPRAIKNIELYGENGGNGLFILDRGVAHGSSQEMQRYIETFILANINSDTPVYPDVTSSNLEAVKFE